MLTVLISCWTNCKFTKFYMAKIENKTETKITKMYELIPINEWWASIFSLFLKSFSLFYFLSIFHHFIHFHSWLKIMISHLHNLNHFYTCLFCSYSDSFENRFFTHYMDPENELSIEHSKLFLVYCIWHKNLNQLIMFGVR